MHIWLNTLAHWSQIHQDRQLLDPKQLKSHSQNHGLQVSQHSVYWVPWTEYLDYTRHGAECSPLFRLLVPWQQSWEQAWFTSGFQMRPSAGNNIFLKSPVVVELDFNLKLSVFKAEALNFYHRSHPLLLYPSHRYEWGSTGEEVGNRVIGRRQSVLFMCLF